MRHNIVNFFIGVILVGVGIVISFFETFNLSYYDKLPVNNYVLASNTYEYNLANKKLSLDYDNHHIKVIEDSSVEGAKVVVSYYQDFTNLKKAEEENADNILVDFTIENAFNNREQKIQKLIINNLKKKEVYNYLKLFIPTIKVYVNPAYKNNLIIIDNYN